MNIKLLTFTMLCVHAIYSSQPEQPLTAQYFLAEFERHFTTMESAQAEFTRNPTDPRFIPKASTNIVKLTALLKSTARLCTTEPEITQFSDHTQRLSSIIEEHMRLIRIHQPTPLRRAQSAILCPTQERALQEQQSSSFRQPKKSSNLHDLD